MNTTRLAALLVCFAVSSAACLDATEPLPAAVEARIALPSARGIAYPTIDVVPAIAECAPAEGQALIVGAACDGHPNCAPCLTEAMDLSSVGTVSDCLAPGTDRLCVARCSECPPVVVPTCIVPPGTSIVTNSTCDGPDCDPATGHTYLHGASCLAHLNCAPCVLQADDLSVIVNVSGCITPAGFHCIAQGDCSPC